MYNLHNFSGGENPVMHKLWGISGDKTLTISKTFFLIQESKYASNL